MDKYTILQPSGAHKVKDEKNKDSNMSTIKPKYTRTKPPNAIDHSGRQFNPTRPYRLSKNGKFKH